jgi:catalase
VSMAEQEDGKVVSEKGIVTVRNSSELSSFGQEFIKQIAQHRHWDREEKEKVPA